MFIYPPSQSDSCMDFAVFILSEIMMKTSSQRSTHGIAVAAKISLVINITATWTVITDKYHYQTSTRYRNCGPFVGLTSASNYRPQLANEVNKTLCRGHQSIYHLYPLLLGPSSLCLRQLHLWHGPNLVQLAISATGAIDNSTDILQQCQFLCPL